MANLFDQRFLLFKNDKYVKAKKADGSNLDLFKVSATDKWEFAVAPEIGGSALQTETQVDAKVGIETSRAVGAEGNLLAQISQEVLDRASAISQEVMDRDAAIAAEAVLRSASDDGIYQSIISESSARVSADASLQYDLDAAEAAILAEAVRAANTESDLQAQINAISGGGSGSLSALQAELDATQNGVGLTSSGEYVVPALSNYMGSTISVSNATSVLDSAIKTVSDNLATEVSDRESAVSGLQTQINNVLSNVDGTALNSLSEIVTSFQQADASLNGAITALATGLSADIDAEEAARIAVDAALQGEIDAEETARAAADATLQNNINSEASARISGDSALSTRIDNEESRAISAESALSGRVGVLESVVWFKEKFSISNGQTSVTLSHVPEPKSLTASIDRLLIHEGASEDFLTSGVTMTFLNDLVSPGQSQIGSGDSIYVKYQYKV